MLSYASLDLAVIASGSGETDTVQAIHLGASATAQTDKGIGVGTKQAAVETALGSAGADPYLGSWWYQTQGLAIEAEAGVAKRLHVF